MNKSIFKTVLVATLMAVVVSMGACGKGDSDDDANKTTAPAATIKPEYTIEISKTVDDIVKEAGAEGLEKITKDDEVAKDVLGTLVDVDFDRVVEMSYYYSDSLADELLFLRLNNSVGVLDIKNQLQERISSRIDTFNAYDPGEVSKLNNAAVVVKGNYVALIVSEKSTYINTEFLKLFEK